MKRPLLSPTYREAKQAMKLWQKTVQFLKDEDGYLISTESVLAATLTVCALVIGIAALRTVVLFLFIDAAEALASRENVTTGAMVVSSETRIGPTAPAPAGNKFFPDVGPLINDMVGDDFRPQPVDATKE